MDTNLGHCSRAGQIKKDQQERKRLLRLEQPLCFVHITPHNRVQQFSEVVCPLITPHHPPWWLELDELEAFGIGHIQWFAHGLASFAHPCV